MEKAYPLLKGARPRDDKHAKEVAEFILEYNKEKKLNFDVLIPLAIMHDIGHCAIPQEHFKYITGRGKVINGKLVHMLAGAKIAKDILDSINYDKKRLRK